VGQANRQAVGSHCLHLQIRKQRHKDPDSVLESQEADRVEIRLCATCP
jgi:hypothetical protein